MPHLLRAAALFLVIASHALAQSPGATPAPAAAAASALVTVAVEVWPTTFDPAARQPGPPTIVAALHEPVVRLKPDSSELDSLSLAARVNVTGDGLLWEIALKANLQFSDGSPIDAEALAFSLGRLLKADHPARPTSPAIPESAKGVLKSLTVKDKVTLVIELSSAYSPLMSLLASPQCSVISPASFKDGKLSDPPIGCGPYMLVKSGPGKHLQLEPNVKMNRQRPGIPRIDVVPSPPGPARLLWLLAGRGDLIEGLSKRDVEDLAAYPKFKVQSAAGLGMVTLYLNPNSTPFQAPLLREAIFRGLPDELLSHYLYDGHCRPFRQFYPPWTWGTHQAFKTYGYDPVEAKRVLTMANVERNGTAFIMWVVPPESVTQDKLAPFLESLRASFRELNISCLTEVVARKDLASRLAAGGPQAVLYWYETVTNDPDEPASVTLAKDSPLARFANVNQDEYFNLVLQARGRDAYSAREFLYGELETKMATALSVVSVGCPSRAAAHSERISGLKFGLDGLVSMEDLKVGP